MTLKNLITHGGATFNKAGEPVSLKTGYQVSKQDLYIMPLENLTMRALRGMIKKHINTRGEYLGVWVDSGKAYIDKSVRVNTLKDATTMGKSLNQISIFGWKRQQAIFLKEGN